MEFSFDGFGISLHWLVITLLFVLSFLLAWYTYTSVEGLKKWQRFTLISLRTSIFLLILIVLLNPLLNIEEAREIRPEIAVLFDHSESVTIQKDDYDGLNSYRQVLENIGLGDTSSVRFNTFGFDRILVKADPDTMPFTGSGTNIAHALSDFLNERNDEQAVIVISDGIFNTGRDPSWQASRYPIPIYTIAVGDTSRMQDIIVQDVIHNDIGYTNTRSSITATVLNDGLPGREVLVQLRKDGVVLEESTFTSQAEREVRDFRFEVELNEEGLKQFEIHVPEVDGEWTTANNTYPFSIEVLDDKINIMLLSFEIHPDIRTIRSILREDISVALDSRTWITEERFVEGEFPAQSDTLSLVILQGFPNVFISPSLQQRVLDYIEGVPLLWLNSPKTDLRQIQRYLPVSPLMASRGSELFDIRLTLPDDNANHPVLELPEIDLRNTPALFGPIRNVTADSDATVLLQANYRGTPTNAPQLTVRTTGNIRSSFLTSFGWYQWYLPGGATRDFTETLFNNLVKWTATADDESLLRIRPDRNIFEESENVSINAFLRNESGAAEDNATIDVVLRGQQIEDRQFTMSNQGLGQYRLQVGNLPRGNYNFTATARKDGRTIEQRSGDFAMGSTNLEFISTIRNDELLNFIANESGGQFFEWNNSANIREILRKDGYFESQIIQSRRDIRAYQHPFWFFMVLLLLTSEWVIRKIIALP